MVQCEVMIRQGLVRRVFGEWQRLCQERDWKTQLATRDNEIKRMDREVCPPSTCALTITKEHTSNGQSQENVCEEVLKYSHTQKVNKENKK